MNINPDLRLNHELNFSPNIHHCHLKYLILPMFHQSQNLSKIRDMLPSYVDMVDLGDHYIPNPSFANLLETSVG